MVWGGEWSWEWSGLGSVRRIGRMIGRMFPEHVERSFLEPEYSFIAVGRILRTIFAKQKVRSMKNQLYSSNTPNYVREQMFAQLRTGFTACSFLN